MKEEYSITIKLVGKEAKNFSRVWEGLNERSIPGFPVQHATDVTKYCIGFTAEYMPVIEEMKKFVQAMNHSTQQTNDTLRELERLTSGMSAFINKDN
ncbi:hypothetical protein ACFVV6_22965 [Bacillus mycoides]|uniref:hypothetical protein n=1 Tax=Bacillus cereus group TaxID=86661 RepID=UPI0018CD9715|nr:hypothetical protein [Bacillus mycoides]MBG9598908.1 hypothetical protein [Bacillus mycoides]MED2763238.1 hypothetical protein [Bacillus thuringiensis]